MYEDQTYDNIINRMVGELDDTIDKREGSVAYDMLAPKATELSMAYEALDNVLSIGFVNTTYGSYLDSKVSEAGITRFAAIASTGSVTFSDTTSGNNEGEVIPAGQNVYTDSGVYFTTNADCTITGGTATANVTAVVAGTAGNVAVGAINSVALSGISVTNAAVTSGGADEESDAALLQRYYSKVQSPGTSGNVADYQNWAMDVEGVGGVKVEPLWNGNGTVRLIIINSSKQPADSTLVNAVNTSIQADAPIGATVTVISATALNINIAATLVLESGYAVTDVQPAITTAIQGYFTSSTFTSTEIKITQIGSLIVGVTGVSDYSNLTLNGGTANITLGDTDVPTIGTVNFTT